MKRGKPLNKVSKLKHKIELRFIPKAVRLAVQERSGFQCEASEQFMSGTGFPKIRCNNPATDMHHVLPKSRGGKNTEENLRHICRMHHRYIHDNPKKASELGLLR